MMLDRSSMPVFEDGEFLGEACQREGAVFVWTPEGRSDACVLGTEAFRSVALRLLRRLKETRARAWCAMSLEREGVHL